MNIKSRKAQLGLVTAVASAALLVPSAAFASNSVATPKTTAADLPTLQQKGEAAIDKRLSAITELQGKVSSNKNATADDKTALGTLLTNDQTRLTALRAKIAADTDVATARADVKSIVSDYRIFLLAAPQVHTTLGADNVTAAIARESDAITKLNGVVAKLKQKGKDTSAIEAQIATAQTNIDAAKAAVAGQSQAILALQPSGYPGNAGSRDAARNGVNTAVTDAKNARAALKVAVQDIKALKGK